MANRLVSVGDDFTLPAAVKVANGNLPAHARPAELAATYAPKGAAFHHDFSNLTDGAPLPAISDSGHLMRYVAGASGNGTLFAGNGGVVNHATTGQAAGYIEVELSSNVKRVGMWVTYPDAGSGSVVPLVWKQSLADRKLSDPVNNAIPASPLHAPISQRSAALQVWPTDGAAGAVTLDSWAYPPAPANELVYLEVVIDKDAYTVILPDGTVRTVRSPYIASNAGKFACFEIFQIDAIGGPAPKIVKIWASDDPDASLTQNSLIAMGRASNATQKPISAAKTSGTATIAIPGTSAASAIDIDAEMRVTAIVPPSGKVLQRINVWVGNTTGTTVFFIPTIYDFTGAGTALKSPSMQVTAATLAGWVTLEYLHTALLPGQNIVAAWQAWATTASVATVRKDSGTGRNITASLIPLP